MNKTYVKEIDGKIVRKQRPNIVIIKDGMQTINPTEEMVLEDGWVEYVQPEPTEEERLSIAKEHKINDIETYDASLEVNSCIISYGGSEMNYWADKHQRSSLKTAVSDCVMVGREYYRLDIRELGLSLNVKCSDLLKMLTALEVYAVDCYNRTTDHIISVKALGDIESVRSYDITSGYPEKLKFEL